MIKRKQRVWNTEEKQLLKYWASRSKNCWQKTAQQLRKRGYIRSGPECRDKWVDLVDPKINRNGWRFDELEKLYKLYAQYSNQWCLIKKELGKTQLQIKNKFYSTLRNYVRTVIKFFLQNYTKSINITPTTLCAVYNAKQQFTFIGNQISSSIEKMRYKIDQNYLRARIRCMGPFYLKLFQVLSQTVNIEGSFFLNIKADQQQNENNDLQLEPTMMLPQAQTPSTQMWMPVPLWIFYEGKFFWI